jgi:hypothetical protein
VQSWVDGKEEDEYVGVGARFGPKIVSKEKYANRTQLTLADPVECCSPPKEKVCLLKRVKDYISLDSVALPDPVFSASFVYFRFLEASFLFKGGNASSQRKQSSRRQLVLLVYSS